MELEVGDVILRLSTAAGAGGIIGLNRDLAAVRDSADTGGGIPQAAG